MRRPFLYFALSILAINIAGAFFYPSILLSLIVCGPLLILGFTDYFQKKHTIRRNFPLIGWFRYLFESIRPEINQYFIESDISGRPLSREQRSIVYQRSKGVLDTIPFGTLKDVYEVGYEWVNHSVLPTAAEVDKFRIMVGDSNCDKPYSTSVLNISAMSYGSISNNAILALNGGAKDGNFAHNTGEGGLTHYHLEPGGDVIWQIGTGYFGCRNEKGEFSLSGFERRAAHPNVKMIELKISQGAKPGHGGILPAAKVTKEISDIRDVPMGLDVISPPGHSAFSTPVEMMQFIETLRKGSGGKPVGFKLCIGKWYEFLAICKAMIETGITPDYIAIDGGEGGTGASPPEYSDSVGSPGLDAIIFAHNALVGFDLRKKIRLFAAGKVTNAFSIIRCLAAGADIMYSARGMMLALGCIQALRCDKNSCPTGIATQNPDLVAGLVVEDKRKRVARYHKNTLDCVANILGSMGLSNVTELRPWHIVRRVSPTEIKNYAEIYQYLPEGSLLGPHIPASYQWALKASSAHTFRNQFD